MRSITEFAAGMKYRLIEKTRADGRTFYIVKVKYSFWYAGWYIEGYYDTLEDAEIGISRKKDAQVISEKIIKEINA